MREKLKPLCVHSYTEPSTGRKLLRPNHMDDLPIFSHCANGMSGVTEENWNTFVVPVLKAHGYRGLIVS